MSEFVCGKGTQSLKEEAILNVKIMAMRSKQIFELLVNRRMKYGMNVLFSFLHEALDDILLVEN